MVATMRVETDNQAYDVALDWLHAAPNTLARLVETHVRPAVQEVVERDLVRYPGPIGQGVFKALATPRQRRYVMAKIRRGEWTGRTGGLGRRWIVRAVPTAKGAVLEVANTSPIARYVVGRNQQRFHFHTSWPTLQSREFELTSAAHVALRNGCEIELRRAFRRKRTEG